MISVDLAKIFHTVLPNFSILSNVSDSEVSLEIFVEFPKENDLNNEF